MKIADTRLQAVKMITPPTIFEDFRGSYVEIYNRELYRQAGIDVDFIQDDISTSTRHVLRGIHGDNCTWKLVSCLYGKFYLLVVDMDANSPTYKRWEAFTLSDTNRVQILIPPLHGNGHVVLSDTAIFHYKQNTSYDRSSQFTILWNDPAFEFWWPVKQPILSRRDDGSIFAAASSGGKPAVHTTRLAPPSSVNTCTDAL
jgi:dTDP-4-dehydrorhamnose 3,5-epimerase